MVSFHFNSIECAIDRPFDRRLSNVLMIPEFADLNRFICCISIPNCIYKFIPRIAPGTRRHSKADAFPIINPFLEAFFLKQTCSDFFSRAVFLVHFMSVYNS